MSSAGYLSVLHAIDGLYESVVTEPQGWNDQAFADWAEEALLDAAELPREALREIRRSLNAARKLVAFWTNDSTTVADHNDWRSRVDIALGPRAWRPTLDLARVGLENAPSPELFEEVKQRFAVVNSERWMDGIQFEEWRAES
ncbi:MAG: hypothetical protein QNJ77_12130 [Acidimicrobiia bacterium]|nr:hypothetical protein [Acidimicrobiia bacterium]